MKNKFFARLTAALTALLLALSLAGCNSGEPAETVDAVPDAAQTTVAAAPEAAKNTPEPIAEQPTPKAETKADSTKAPAKTTSGRTTGTVKTTPKKAATTKRATTGAPQRSLIARAIDTSVQTEMNLINDAVSFGRDTIKFLTGRDPLIDVQIRSRTNATGGVQLFLYIKNRSGRPIRLNGYSNFTIKDLLNEEVLSTTISLNEPIVLDDQEDTWLSVTLPSNWMASDELRQLTLEAGLFNSTIAVDYDLL